MKIKYLVGAFLATALLISGCGDDTAENAEQQPAQTNLAGQRLTDDNGVEYTLIDNGDGTETARYDDGRSVTFRRQEDGSLDYLAGAAGLIAGMAAGYYLFHGFSSPAGTWNSAQNRYTVSEPLKRDDRTGGGGYAGTSTKPSGSASTTPAPSTSATNKPPTSSATTANSGGVNLSKPETSSAAKTGFGGAGARTGSSAVS